MRIKFEGHYVGYGDVWYHEAGDFEHADAVPVWPLMNSSGINETLNKTVSLQVTLEPVGARDAGAQWRVDGGAWQNSGATVSGLSSGDHMVEYKDITGWTKPTSPETVGKVEGHIPFF